MIRSVLIAPADDAARLERALGSAADMVAVDLRAASDRARDAAASLVRTAGRPTLVRLRPLDDPRMREDLAAFCRAGAGGFILRAAESAADIHQLGAMLAVEEAEAGLDDGSLAIVAVTETSGALFELGAIAKASARMVALGWNGEALAVDLGAEVDRDEGFWIDPLATARTLTLAAAADARLAALDSLCSLADPDQFREEAETARRDGFSAKFALDEAQVRIANEVFYGSGAR